MKRLDYEAPTMEEIVVEMENGFLGGSIDVKNTQNAAIDNHEINTDFNVDFSATDESGNYKNGGWK